MHIIEKIKRYHLFIFCFIVTVVLLAAYALQLSVPVIGDETVTMANGAVLAGYDWSLMVAATGGRYYKYLQPLLMAPLFKWIDDPEMIYRMAMCIHALLQASVMAVAYVIGRRYLRIKNEKICILLSMAACLVPALVLYTYYFRGDVLLGIFPWYVLAAFMETMRAEKDGRKLRRVICTALAVLFSVFSYMAHTRGIVVILALLLAALVVRILGKCRSLNWALLAILLVVLLWADMRTGGDFRNALYSVGGVKANTVSSMDMGSYFDLFSWTRIKGMIMLCISWMFTLFSTTYGLALVGIFVSFIILIRGYLLKSAAFTEEEKAITVFGFAVFIGYFLVGALFFKGIYTELSSGVLEQRSDRLLYDRYVICGCGILIYLALYGLVCKKDWIKLKGKIVCMSTGLLIVLLFFWKPVHLVTKYPGYIYNTIILATFQKIDDAASILTGTCYDKTALAICAAFAFVIFVALFIVSGIPRDWVPYAILGGVLAGELLLIQVNYSKMRKAANDWVLESTEDVVGFMRELEPEVADEFPYVLKGGLSGVKIQFYQSQLMSYQMFGKKNLEEVNSDSYFIISEHGDIALEYCEDDCYLFEDFDYDAAKYDIVYVKGEALKEKLEELGFQMIKYETLSPSL